MIIIMIFFIITQDLHNAMKMLGLNPMEQEIIDLTNNISRNIWQYIWFQYWFTTNQSINNNISCDVNVWCHKHDYFQQYQHHYHYDRNIFKNINVVWCHKTKPWNHSGMVSSTSRSSAGTVYPVDFFIFLQWLWLTIFCNKKFKCQMTLKEVTKFVTDKFLGLSTNEWGLMTKKFFGKICLR